MNSMLFSLIVGAPLWIWPLLALLIGYGIRASQDRETSVLPVYLLPLLGLITLHSVVNSFGGVSVWVAYGAAYLGGAAGGYALQKRWLLARNGWRVTLKGEWITLIVVMTLFWMNYAWSATVVISPDFIAQITIQMAFAVTVGLASGSLLGRALRVAANPPGRASLN
jgi:hypothetical protein